MNRGAESGNVIFFVLLAVVLLGLVTAALRSGGFEGANIDRESLAIKASEVQQYAGELERAVRFVMQNGASEVDIRFAHPDANTDYGDINTNSEFQVFHVDGGGAEYRSVPSGINDGSAWEFYGHTHLPQVGTARSELIAVLPNASEAFCEKINELNGYDAATQPEDDVGDCLNAGAAYRFDDGTQFTASGGEDTTDEATFTVLPAMQGCVDCDPLGTHDYHFFHVLMTR